MLDWYALEESVDKSKMAPCPFCGQQGDYYIEEDGRDVVSGHVYSVECTNCRATYYGSPHRNRQTALKYAIDGWNSRA